MSRVSTLTRRLHFTSISTFLMRRQTTYSSSDTLTERESTTSSTTHGLSSRVRQLTRSTHSGMTMPTLGEHSEKKELKLMILSMSSMRLQDFSRVYKRIVTPLKVIHIHNLFTKCGRTGSTRAGSYFYTNYLR